MTWRLHFVQNPSPYIDPSTTFSRRITVLTEQLGIHGVGVGEVFHSVGLDSVDENSLITGHPGDLCLRSLRGVPAVREFQPPAIHTGDVALDSTADFPVPALEREQVALGNGEERQGRAESRLCRGR